MRIIPAIDIMGGQVVRLYRGDPSKKTIYGNDPVETASRWEAQGADMIHVVDLDATLSRGGNSDIILKMAHAVSVPIQAAGGLRSEDAVAHMLQHVERIVIGTLALNRDILLRLLERFRDRVVVSVDHKNGRVATHGWMRDSGLPVYDAVEAFASSGVTQFLMTDVSRDGTLKGPDLQGLERVCHMGDVIASGGISGISDVKAVSRLNPYGVILGKALYEGKITIREALQC